ncbi:MAG TPA: PA domain-containing protein, partial [Pyrinomonadaceae bacterium]|nr:PA domain-containing protein [Pyrinomonadaceae bacterium]
MINYLISRFPAVLLMCVIAISSAASATAAATVEVKNNDAVGVGFNDATPVSPVGGNSGTTLGQQRLNAFQHAANIWGANVTSSTKIIIRAQWEALSCSANSAVLASAGTITIHQNFPNAPFADTWYGAALANAIAGSDRNGATAEIDATVNINIGSPTCFSGSPWYLGFDNNHGDGTDLVTVLLHEFGHGLGFQSFTDVTTGAFDTGFPSIFDRFLRDNTTGKVWTNMTNAERAASATNDGNLVWTGPQVTAAVPTVLQGEPTLKINSPPIIARNYNIGTAEFGPQVSFPGVTASLVRPSVIDGCGAMTGVTGQIAFIDRGGCLFVEKVKNAQNAGALAVVIGNVSDSLDPTIAPGMAGTDPTITIPSVSLNLSDADSIRAQLGGPINASVFQDPNVRAGADSSNRAKLYAPPQVDEGSSVSHFDTSMFPNQLMEPNINGDLTHNVTVPNDLTFSLLRDIGWNAPSTPATIQLSASAFNANENGTSLNVGITRSGDTSGVVSVDYATSDNSGANPCNLVTGHASSRCDYLTGVGRLTFAAGETSKTISIPIIDDVYAEGAETFQITLSNPSGASLGTPATATLTINDGQSEGGVNPIDTPSFFVRQHYIDFLNREPDQGGLTFWTNEITGCGVDPQCIEVKRINVSAAFF